MKDILTSNCEKEFILNIDQKRIDGRQFPDGRSVTVLFGTDRGCCTVMQGNTSVLSQVSCEVVLPKPSRPSEGILNVNLELSPMAAPNFEIGRPMEIGIEYARILERCIRDSHCIDLESLCIVAGEKVWSIRVDVHVLNHDGNILECASIAAIASLCHFKRPDVTVIGTEVTIHSIEEHEPIPLNLHHMPLCITFAVFHGKHLLVDPTEIEERVSDGKMVVGVNAHQEICTLHLSGSLLLSKEKIMQCAHMASVRAQEITEVIKEALEKDTSKRISGEDVGFAALLRTDTILGLKYQPPSLKLRHSVPEVNSLDYDYQDVEIPEAEDKVNILGPGTASIGEEGPSSWNIFVQDNEDLNDQIYAKKVPKWKDSSSEPDDEQESEEEEQITLRPEELGIKQEPEEEMLSEVQVKAEEDYVEQGSQIDEISRGWYAKNAFL